MENVIVIIAIKGETKHNTIAIRERINAFLDKHGLQKDRIHYYETSLIEGENIEKLYLRLSTLMIEIFDKS